MLENDDSVVRMPVTLRRGEKTYTLIDEQDYPAAAEHSWCLNGQGYPCCMIGNKIVFLHRFLLQPPAGIYIDHINLDQLDNRRCNLRFATASQNHANTVKRHGRYRGRNQCSSRYKGVSWHAIGKRWHARITVNGKSIYLGLYKNEEDAAHVYDVAAREYFGEYARLNLSNKPILSQRGTQ